MVKGINSITENKQRRLKRITRQNRKRKEERMKTVNREGKEEGKDFHINMTHCHKGADWLVGRKILKSSREKKGLDVWDAHQ